jgi:amphi-Trp domain-containing protein
VTAFEHEERISRQQAAERLADIAYALTTGGTLELRSGDELIRVRVADEVLLRRHGKATGEDAGVEVALSWIA